MVGIHQNFSTLANMREYESLIRGVIGSEIDLRIVHGEEYWKLEEYPNGHLNDCNPSMSGIEMQVDNHGSYTIGMKATYKDKSGFVTAGHCADGETCRNVGQDSIISVIGTVLETYTAGSAYETCDCAFIETESGSRNMTAGVYWQSYYPTSAVYASLNDYVKFYGHNGMTYGYVENTCRNITYGKNTTLRRVVIVDNDADAGDSGRYVAQTFDPTPEFHGIFAYTSDSSAYVKHSGFTPNFTGLEWDFS